MRTIETTKWSLGLGLMLSSLGACAPPLGPDQQEAGFEKSGPDQSGGPDKADKLTKWTETPGPAQRDDTPQSTVIDAYLRCFDSCAGKSGDDRFTCHKNCAAVTTAGSGHDPTASACPRSCITAFGSCLEPCVDERSEDDSATCRGRCRAAAENCVDGCN